MVCILAELYTWVWVMPVVEVQSGVGIARWVFLAPGISVRFERMCHWVVCFLWGLVLWPPVEKALRR